MPNHIKNILTITSSVDDVLAFLRGDNGAIDFNSIAPMPSILRRVVSNGCERDGFNNLCIMEPTEENPYAHRPATPEECAEIKATGYRDWYFWSIAEWGTKWNAYEISVTGNTIRFETAWSGVPELMTLLSLRFPDVLFWYAYADEDTGRNCGCAMIQGGKIGLVMPPEASCAAYELAFMLRPESREYYKLDGGTYKSIEADE